MRASGGVLAHQRAAARRPGPLPGRWRRYHSGVRRTICPRSRTTCATTSAPV